MPANSNDKMPDTAIGFGEFIIINPTSVSTSVPFGRLIWRALRQGEWNLTAGLIECTTRRAAPEINLKLFLALGRMRGLNI